MKIIKMLKLKKISLMKKKMKINRLWIALNMLKKNLVKRCQLQSNFNLMVIHQSNLIPTLMQYRPKLILVIFRIWINLIILEFVTFKIKIVEMASFRKKRMMMKKQIKTLNFLNQKRNQRKQNHYIKKNLLRKVSTVQVELELL